MTRKTKKLAALKLPKKKRAKKAGKAMSYNMDRDGVTQTFLLDWLDCRKRTSLMLEGWRKDLPPKGSLRFGSMVHEVLENVYLEIREGTQDPDDLKKIVEDWVDAITDSTIKEHSSNPAFEQECHLEAAKAVGVLHGYIDHWLSADIKREWVGVENKFKVDFNGFKLRGMMDGVFTVQKGKRPLEIWMLETKTKSKISEGILTDKLSLDFQNLFYLTALQRMEEFKDMKPSSFKGVLYNIIRVPGLRQKKDESMKQLIKRINEDVVARPDHYFIRYEVNYPVAERCRFEQDLMKKLADFRDWNDGKLRTYRSERHCSVFWNCEFLQLCAQDDTAGYVQDRILFPELQEK